MAALTDCGFCWHIFRIHLQHKSHAGQKVTPGIPLQYETEINRKSAVESYCWATMKKAAIILGIFAFLQLMYLPKAFHLNNNPRWLLDILASVGGVLLLLVSIGIWTRKKFAWYLGFIYLGEFIVISGMQAHFISQGLGDKVPPLIICIFPAVIVSVFWAVVWHRQKKWFYHDQLA
jgi:hypothetical protein